MSFSYSLCYYYASTGRQDLAVAETALIKTLHLWKVFWLFKLLSKFYVTTTSSTHEMQMSGLDMFSASLRPGTSGQGEVRQKRTQVRRGRDWRSTERSYETSFAMH